MHGPSIIRSTYVLTIRYTCVLKNMCLTHGMRNMHLQFLEKPYAYILKPMHYNSYFFSKRTFYVSFGKGMFKNARFTYVT